jgi:hypothetical protein
MPRLRFGFGISRINDSDGQEIIGRESPVVREEFVSNQFQELLPIGLIMNDRLRVVAVSGEGVERTRGCSSRWATNAHGARVGRSKVK